MLHTCTMLHTYLRCSQEFVFAQAGIPGLSFAALETGRSTEETFFFCGENGWK
jgi:hypothetical protein